MKLKAQVPSLAQAPSKGLAWDPSPLFHKVMCLGKICTSKDVFTTNGEDHCVSPCHFPPGLLCFLKSDLQVAAGSLGTEQVKKRIHLIGG